MKKIFTVLAFFALVSICYADPRYYDPSEVLSLAPGTAQNRYIDGTNGNDATADGTLAKPYKTIAKALDRYSGLAYGARIIIKAGRYRESVDVPSNLAGTGSESNRLIVGPYGDGEVIIDRSENVAWTVHSGNVYKCTLSSGVIADSIVVDDNYKSCRPVGSLAAVIADGQWFQSGTTLYLYSGSATPSSRGAMVRRFDEDNTIFGATIIDRSYVTIYGLTILSSPSLGVMYYNCNYGVVQKCKIKYCGKNAVVFGGTNNLAEKNYLYANCMMNWPRGSKWGSNGGWPTAINMGNLGTVRGCIVAETGGEGINMYGGGTGALLIEDNIVYNNYSVNIYVDSHPNATIRRNFVYCSGISTADITAVIPAYSTLESIARRLRGEGIMIGDETAAGGGSANEQIYDNVIVACRDGILHYSQATGSGWLHDRVYNNTIILPNANPSTYSDSFYGILSYTNANNTDTIFKNNIIIGGHANSRLVYKGTDTGLTFNNNIYYHPNQAAPFSYNGASKNFADWKTSTGQDASSKYENPNLNRSDWSIFN